MQTPGSMDFILKPLALTDFPSASVEDTAGGCLVTADQSWLAIWKPEQIEDPDKLLLNALASAKAQSTNLAGALVLTWPQQEQSPQVQELADAFVVYGLNPLSQAGQWWPDLVMMLNELPKSKAESKSEITAAAPESDSLDTWLQTAKLEEQLLSPFAAFRALTDLAVHRTADDDTAGLVAVRQAGLIGRLAALWVPPGLRGRGLGKALLRKAVQASTERQELRLFAFAARSGKLRYFLAKMGFAENMVALRYVAE